MAPSFWVNANSKSETRNVFRWFAGSEFRFRSTRNLNPETRNDSIAATPLLTSNLFYINQIF